jgi:hypothetical protein
VVSFVARVAEKKRILVPHFVTDLANLEKNKPHSFLIVVRMPKLQPMMATKPKSNKQ